MKKYIVINILLLILVTALACFGFGFSSGGGGNVNGTNISPSAVSIPQTTRSQGVYMYEPSGKGSNIATYETYSGGISADRRVEVRDTGLFFDGTIIGGSTSSGGSGMSLSNATGTTQTANNTLYVARSGQYTLPYRNTSTSSRVAVFANSTGVYINPKTGAQYVRFHGYTTSTGTTAGVFESYSGHKLKLQQGSQLDLVNFGSAIWTAVMTTRMQITSTNLFPAPAPSSYLLEEDFTAGTAPSGWSATGAGLYSYNYATSPAPDGGSGYSLELNSISNANSTTVTSTTFTASADVYVAAWYSLSGATPGDVRDIIAIRTASATLCAIQQDTGNNLDGQNTGGTQVANFITVSVDTPLYVKIRYQKDTDGGTASAICTFWTSADGSSWTSEGSSTNGTSTADADRLQFSVSGSGEQRHIWDRLRVSATDINY